MTKTLIARGGALSALALVLALAAPAVPAEAQNRAEAPRAERQQMRVESRGTRQAQRAAQPSTPRAERAPRPERVQPRPERDQQRPERVQQRSDGDRFGADVMRRAGRAAEPDARPATMLREDRFDRHAEQIDRRSERRADTVERRSERRADTVERRGERRADAIEDRGDRRAVRVGSRGDGGAERVGDRRDDWRDGRRDDWRDGRRDDWRGDRRDDWRDDRRDRRNWRRDDWRWNWNGRPGWDNRDFRRWNRGWRQVNHYDWYDYRRANHFLFRPGLYYPPYRSHRYNRLNIGYYLDSLFFQPHFFINDPWTYRLPPAYGPYQWVRYYDDVLLVDIYTGEVVDVIHDFFW